MRFVLLVPILYLVAVVETSLGDLLRIGTVEPDLLALLAVVWLLRWPGPWAFLVAGLIGLAEDLLAPGRLGLGLGSFLLIGYALALLRTRFRLGLLVLQVAAVLVAVCTLTTIQAVGHWLLGTVSVSLPTLLARAASVGLYTAGLSLPVLMILNWLTDAPKRPRVSIEPGGP